MFSAIVVATVVASPEVILRLTSVDRRLFPDAFEDVFEKEQRGWWRLITYDPVLGWHGRPRGRLPGSNEFLNERGFRGSDFTDEKPAGLRRVVCLGDSATFGLVCDAPVHFSYQPTYSGELERLLNRDVQLKRVQVINAGVIGYSTWQGLRLLKHHVRDWHPDVITIRFGINDQWVEARPPVPPEPRNAFLRWGLDRLLDLRTYEVIVRLKTAHERVAGARSIPPQPRVSLPAFEENLRALVENGRAMGAEVLLLTSPYAPITPEIAANDKLLKMTGFTSWEAVAADHEHYEDVVRKVAADMNVVLVDTTREFDARGRENFFSHYDLVHPDGRGHVAIAEQLARVIPAAHERPTPIPTRGRPFAAPSTVVSPRPPR